MFQHFMCFCSESISPSVFDQKVFGIVEKTHFFGRTFSSSVGNGFHISEKHTLAPGKHHLCSASLADSKRGRAAQCRIRHHITLAFVTASRNTFRDTFRQDIFYDEGCRGRRLESPLRTGSRARARTLRSSTSSLHRKVDRVSHLRVCLLKTNSRMSVYCILPR